MAVWCPPRISARVVSAECPRACEVQLENSDNRAGLSLTAPLPVRHAVNAPADQPLSAILESRFHDIQIPVVPSLDKVERDAARVAWRDGCLAVLLLVGVPFPSDGLKYFFGWVEGVSVVEVVEDAECRNGFSVNPGMDLVGEYVLPL